LKTSPRFFCYAPRPKHANLDGLAAEICLVLKEARGIFARGGMEARLILARLLERPRAIATAPSLKAVATELRKLRGLEIAEQVAAHPERWRLKK
jgi:hypothetical protein